jgi:acetaldehyde dehydrogenase
MTKRAPCIILGSGNIGTDLMMKLLRSDVLEVAAVVGIDPGSEGLALARKAGITVSSQGVDWILEHHHLANLVFDATSASAHRANSPKLRGLGLRVIDLTPAKLGPGVVPVVNLLAHLSAQEVSLLSCGAQATIPIVAAVSAISDVAYAEIVSTIASKSAGPGTRQNIDEFTATTAAGLETIGGAVRGKAIIILNPAEPPILMRNTVYCAVPHDLDLELLNSSIKTMVERVSEYVPGYRLRAEPVFDEGRVAVIVEVEGVGDYLPRYSGNLDIMTAAAVRVGEQWTTNGAQQ